MIINSAAVIYFSPTGTTKRILNSIVKGMGIENPYIIDITFPKIRNSVAPILQEDIVIIGVPVYEERVPNILKPFLTSLKGSKRPVVIVAVYGNIGDGIVLNELKSITEYLGFKVVAAGSFIGEHSFSTKELPIAEGHPTIFDLERAHEFGKMIKNKMEETEDLIDNSLVIPNSKLPLIAKILPENSAKMFTKTPSVDWNLCNHCGLCAKFCPMAAIHKDTLVIDEKLCLRCFSCVKKCKREARHIIYKKKLLVTRMLTAKNKVIKWSKIYL